MLRFETLEKDSGECIFEMKGFANEIGPEAAYMMVLIYRCIYKSDPMEARIFRKTVLYAINGAFDAIERGDL